MKPERSIGEHPFQTDFHPRGNREDLHVAGKRGRWRRQ